MSEAVEGVIHGKTIELAVDPGLQDGQRVEVVIRRAGRPKAWARGSRRPPGCWPISRRRTSTISTRSSATADGGRIARSQNVSTIVSTAFAYDLIVVPEKICRFAVIPGLRLEDWLAP